MTEWQQREFLRGLATLWTHPSRGWSFIVNVRQLVWLPALVIEHSDGDLLAIALNVPIITPGAKEWPCRDLFRLTLLPAK